MPLTAEDRADIRQIVMDALRAKDLPSESARSFVSLHSLTAREFAACAAVCEETVRVAIRARSSRIAPFAKGRPYRINGAKSLPLWGVTLELAQERLRTFRAELAQTQSKAPQQSAA